MPPPDRTLAARLGHLRAKLARSETARTGGTAGVLVAIKVAGTLGTFLYTVLMARMLTPQEFGIVWTLWSGVFVASYIVTLNVGAGAIREIVRAKVDGALPIVAGFLSVCRRVLLLATGPVLLAFVAFVAWRSPDIWAAHPLAVLLAAATIPVMGWNQTNAMQATALDMVLRGQVPMILLRPAIFLVVLGTLWLVGAEIGLALVVGTFLAVSVVVAVVQYVVVWRSMDGLDAAVPATEGWKRWIRNGLVLTPGRLLTNQMRSVFLLVAAVPLGAVEVAQMAVALSIVSFMNFALAAVEMAFSPKISREVARDLAAGTPPGRMRRALDFLVLSGGLRVALIAAGAAALWLFMPLLIWAFGAQYGEAAAVAWIFMAIPLGNAVFGNTPLVLQVFGREVDILVTSALAMVALPLGGIALAPSLIAAGGDPLIVTAAVLAGTMVALQAVRWVLCRRRTGLDPSAPGSWLQRRASA